MWWERHALELLDLKRHLYAPRITSSTPLIWNGRPASRRDEERPMRRAVKSVIIPTLRIALDDANLHRELRYSIVIALGRVGAVEHAQAIRSLSRRNNLAEPALLSLALMCMEPGHPDSDRIGCWIGDMAQDPALTPRTRKLARFLCQRPPTAAPALASPDAARGRFLLTVARQGETRWLPFALAWLDDAAAPPLTLRAAAVAAGCLASEAPPRLRRSIVDRLRTIVRDESADLELRVVCCFALGETGTTDARLDLIDFARTQSLPIRLAALFTAYRDLRELAPTQRKTLRASVRQLEGPADYAATIDLCRGLYRDTSAIPDLVARIPNAKQASIALGLLGHAPASVVEALSTELKRTSDPTVRRNVALALAMLRVHDLDDRLQKRFDAARTFQDQAAWLETIGRVGTHRNVPPLIEIAFDERRPIALRAAAVQALGRMGDLRRRSPFKDDARVFVPGLVEPRVATWLAQR